MSRKSVPVHPDYEGRTDAPHAPSDIDIGRPIDPAAPAPAPDAPVAPVERKPVAPAIQEGRLKLAESARQVWRVTVPGGVNPDDLLKPEYWRHVSRKFTVGDLVEVLAEDWTYFGIGIVRATGKDGALVQPIQGAALPEPEELEAEDFAIKHIPGLDFVVVRKSDGARVSENHKSRGAAYGWLAANAGRA
jgi:hypothetical protein